jgi:hypothetical protein
MRRTLVAMACLLALGCGSPAVVETALRGDLPTLQRQIRDRQAAGDLDRDTVLEVARAVGGRELRSSKGEAAVQRVRQVRACAGALLPVLRDRAERLDEAGAEATLVLLETGRVAPAGLVDRYRDASDGAWRAVAARAAVAPQHGELRRSYVVDPDQRVRRAALAAAGVAHSSDDVDVLLEAARLDPDPLSRGLAAQALGEIGGSRVTLALRDYWPRADEATRLMFIESWARPAAYAAGGVGALIWVAETEGGLPAIAAARVLVEHGGEGRRVGLAVFLRAMHDGTREERRLALQVAPISDSDLRAELERSARDSDRGVEVMALARLVGDPGARARALPELRKLAGGKGSIAVQARAALAAARDASMIGPLEEQLRKGNSHDRRVAALALVALGRYASAALALADDDPRVRVEVACSMLTEAAAR